MQDKESDYQLESDRSTSPDYQQEHIFPGNGEMSLLMRTLDWSVTPIGSVEHWTQSLRTSLSICLSSRFPILIWWGKELVMLYNDAYRPILGTTKHPQALGQSGSECWSEIWDIIGPMLEGVMITGNATWSDDQLLLIDRNGYLEECYFTFSYSPIRDETGGIGGVFTAVTETTERVLSERRLRTLRELAAKTSQAKTVEEACELSMETLADNVADIPFALIYLLDEAGKQAKLIKAGGLAPQEIACQETLDLLSDDTHSLPLVKVVRTGEPERVNNWGPSSYADLADSALILPITQANHDLPAGLLVVGINPRRALDEEYSGFFQLIAGNIATAIANARAYETERKRAEALFELDRAKTTFFSNISHEFRTPLTLIIAPLEEMLRRLQQFAPQDQEQLQLIHRNSQRLLKLVNSLLDFSRIEAGRVQAVYEPIDLAAFTAELASLFRSVIEAADMRLIVQCLPLRSSVYVDRQMWEKIVLNLLSNAFKFTFQGEITLTLRECQNYVELEISDTGTGIPESEIPHLFERFHRVKGAKGRSFEGSGIGLSLVQELVKLHGGTITVSSIVDQGTSFVVSIPTGYAHLPSVNIGAINTLASTAIGATSYVEEALRWLPAEGTGDSLLGGKGEREKGKGKELLPITDYPLPITHYRLPITHYPIPNPQSPISRILLADDNADMRDYVKRLLQQNYQVEAVGDGLAAASAIRQQPFDLVLTDIMMPGLDGFELLRQLRQDPLTKEIPIILLSARAGEESRIEGLEFGADDYLVKPFSARELLARVEATIKLSKMRQSMKQVLQDANEHLTNVLENMTDAFVAFDREWRITYVNQQTARINNMQPEEMIGKTQWEMWSWSIGTIIEQKYRQAVAEQTPVHFEVLYEPLMMWLEIHAYPSKEGIGIYFRDITTRKAAETSLQNALQRLNFHVENSPLAVIEWDHEFRVSRWSSEAERIFGWQASEVIGKNFQDWQFVFTEDLEVVTDAATRLTGRVNIGNSCYNFSYTKDNSIVYCEWYSSTLFDESGKLISVLSLVLDVTERKVMEAALRESEERFREMADASPTLIWMSDPSKLCNYFNKTWLEFTGRTIEQEMGNGWTEGVHPEDLQYCIDIYINAFDAREKFSMEYRLKRYDGEYRWILDKGVPRFTSSGNFLGYIGSCIDISDRKIAEAEREEMLVRSQQYASQLRGLTEAALTINSALSIEEVLQVITERSRFIIGAHQSVTSMTIDNNWAQSINAVSLSDKYAPRRDYKQPTDSSGIYAYICQINRPIRMTQSELEQHPQWHFDTETANPPMRGYLAAPLTGRDGSNIGLIQLSDKYDAGEFTAEDEAILVQLAQMASVAIENTRLYEAEQLARTQAESANRIKDEFLAVLSHELRTPLNPILGWSKLLRTRKFDETKTAEALATIERNAKLQAQLIEDLLDVSRILRGKLTLNVDKVSPGSIILAALETVRLAAEAKSISIVTIFDLNVGQIAGDAGRLQQVIWNLLSNAVKFTPNGGRVEVRLSVEWGSGEWGKRGVGEAWCGGVGKSPMPNSQFPILNSQLPITNSQFSITNSYAKITVSDTGKGISPEFLPYVFDYFRQADSATTRKFGGLGLGLAIVRQLVELHGGTVFVESLGEGQGATFTVKLPLFSTTDSLPIEFTKEAELNSFNLEGIKILIVDDDADSRDFITFVLQQEKAEVIAVDSALSALQILAKSKPDVLLSDIGMPEMDGYMLIKQVRKWLPEQGGEIPAIALTAYAGEYDRKLAISAGFSYHVPKPADPAQLIAAVTKLTNKS
ncbi:multi-sensor signal transduction histidine kinase [Tolypothrix sp. NIES-4075]|uniref:ATP-binding protein n=1 Tax=Tolypothrix sp. NIES-4075 TaxID=2005459 RepID=UPI000B5C6CF8|nr:ATP-binding protein [Tolypothrix sp. NIES-4075]GAX44668.1 multi-sensor signal transduction histidine kinase [Tolypothrix sp. NIES-4075]